MKNKLINSAVAGLFIASYFQIIFLLAFNQVANDLENPQELWSANAVYIIVSFFILYIICFILFLLIELIVKTAKQRLIAYIVLLLLLTAIAFIYIHQDNSKISILNAIFLYVSFCITAIIVNKIDARNKIKDKAKM